MADDFLDQLTPRLQDFAAEVERTTVPALKAGVGSLKNTYGSLLELLKKKGILTDDPYQYNEKISELTPIPHDLVLENQKLAVMTTRMHSFERQLAYLADFYPLALDYLNLARLRSISQFLRFVRWESFSEASTDINTKVVAELVGKVRKGEDTVSSGLVNDMVGQMNAHTVKVVEALKRITLLKREEYKLLVRQSFWTPLGLAAEEVRGNADNVQKRVRNAFAQHLKGQPYIPELIKELLDEDFAPNASFLRDEVFHRIEVKKAAAPKTQQVVDPRTDLVEAARILATVNIPMDAGLRKLQDNLPLLPNGNQSLFEKFEAWVRRLLKLPGKPKIFPIDLFDPATGATKREPLEFDPFVAEVQTRVRVLAAVANRNSPQFATLGQRSIDEITGWFERQFIDASKTVERLNGLDLFFKTEVAKEKRGQVKGIKAEVAQIRTVMGNANKARHEAMGRIEEQEQLKRLGIR